MNYIYKPIKSYYPKAKKSRQKLSSESKKISRALNVLGFLLVLNFFHDPMQETLKNGLAALWAFLFIGLSIHQSIFNQPSE